MNVPSFEFLLLVAGLLCSVVTGFLLAFAIVVMPGTGRLDDHSFLRAFQVMDRVIQNNQPLFVFVWLGSVLSVLGVAVMSFWVSAGTDRVLAVAAVVAFVFGVQLPTVTINIPMNNEIQRFDLEAASEAAKKRARVDFESRWNRWNIIRTVFSALASILLLVLLLRT